LDNREVSTITSFFEDFVDIGKPKKIMENDGRIFQGSIFLGKGFLLTEKEARLLTLKDQKNMEVIFRTINGKEINSIPNQNSKDYIINFYNWKKEKAKKYILPFRILEEKVKPFRDKQKKRNYRENWWIYAERCPGLYQGIAKLKNCFVTTMTTKYLNFSSVCTEYIFTNSLFVFITDRWDLYSVVQSSIHEQWARKYSGALATILRYSRTNCFATFPFPGNIWKEENSELAQIGETYHAYRKSLMLKLWLGLTDLYNLFHDPELSEEMIAAKCKNPEVAHEGYLGILKLRELHK